MSGWIKIHRAFNKWEWKDSPKHVAVFLDLLLEANHKDNRYRGELILKGSLTTSYAKISQRTGVSVRGVRTVIKDLISTHEVTYSSNAKRSMITVVKWDDYQQATSQTTIKRQSNDNQTTTNKNEKNVKNEKNKGSCDLKAVIDHLNLKAGKKYLYTSESSNKFINARLEDYSVSDLKRVIDFKVTQWKGTSMATYLRPATLFNETKFTGYVNEAPQETIESMDAKLLAFFDEADS